MRVVTVEVRELDERGSHLLYAATDVPNEDEALAATLFRVTALVCAIEVEEGR